MNRSTKSLLGASLFASLAAAAGVAATSLEAHDSAEPAAYTVKSAADRTASARRAKGDPQQAITKLGKSTVRDTGLRMSSSGVLAECASAADGAVRGPMKLAGGRRVGHLSTRTPEMPVDPPADYHVPVHDPNAVLMLSKQVSDPFGGMTMSGASVDTSPGTPAAVRRFGVEHCESVRRARATRRVSAADRQSRPGGVVDPVTSLSGAPGGLPRASTATPHRLVRGLPRVSGLPRRPAAR